MYRSQHKCRAIMEATETVFGLPERSIRGHRRNREFSYPRFLAIKAMREVTNLSTTQIGYVVNRDHTTVISALRRADELIAQDAEYGNKYQHVKQLAQDLAGFDFVRGSLPIFKSVRSGGENTCSK